MTDHDREMSGERANESRQFDYLLLTATLAFADEFRVDHLRRAESERSTELGAILAARLALKVEVSELETRVGRILRSLTVGELAVDADLLVRGYAVLDLNRIVTAIGRIHRHLLTLYPSISPEIVEAVRLFGSELEVATRSTYHTADFDLNALLSETLEIANAVYSEIG
ncbi:MAG: hypothetical protein HKN13_05985 [Rhodothermales bacterium]|nr:hypothetical protein [Rhodothermales bacterium]